MRASLAGLFGGLAFEIFEVIEHSQASIREADDDLFHDQSYFGSNDCRDDRRGSLLGNKIR